MKKTILITGSTDGIGLLTAKKLSMLGNKILLHGRNKNKLIAISKMLNNAPIYEADFSDMAAVEDMSQKILLKNKSIDVLINNAGNMYRGNIDELEESKLIEIFNSNVISGMLLLGKAKQYLRATEGVNIFIGSVHNRRAFPGASPYAATKGALETLTRVLAAELGKDKIRVNCVVPGAIFTEINQRAGLFDDDQAKKRLNSMAKIHALGEIGTPEDISEAVEYLINARWTTGAILDVDGGLGLGLTED